MGLCTWQQQDVEEKWEFGTVGLVSPGAFTSLCSVVSFGRCSTALQHPACTSTAGEAVIFFKGIKVQAVASIFLPAITFELMNFNQK